VPDSNRTTIRRVQAQDVALWLSLTEDQSDILAKSERLAQQLAGGTFNPLLLLMAFNGDKAAAGLAARRQNDSAVRIYPPKLAPHLSPASIASLGIALVQNMEREVLSALPDVERLETKPADDVPAVERWLSVLETAGFRELACGHTHRLELAAWQASDLPPPLAGFSIEAITSTDDVALRDLYAAVVEVTQDRIDRSYRLAAERHFGILKRQVGGAIVRDLWRVARMNGRAVGFAVGASHLDGGDRAISGWVLDVGVVPVERGRGFGARLLIDVISALARAGNTEVRAAIDDVNGTSLALHAKLGFRPIEGRYLTYEKRLRPLRAATAASPSHFLK